MICITIVYYQYSIYEFCLVNQYEFKRWNYSYFKKKKYIYISISRDHNTVHIMYYYNILY